MNTVNSFRIQVSGARISSTSKLNSGTHSNKFDLTICNLSILFSSSHIIIKKYSLDGQSVLDAIVYKNIYRFSLNVNTTEYSPSKDYDMLTIFKAIAETYKNATVVNDNLLFIFNVSNFNTKVTNNVIFRKSKYPEGSCDNAHFFTFACDYGFCTFDTLFPMTYICNEILFSNEDFYYLEKVNEDSPESIGHILYKLELKDVNKVKGLIAKHNFIKGGFNGNS